MPLSVFKVRIIRVISVRKLGRVEKFYILLTELGSYVGFSIAADKPSKSRRVGFAVGFFSFRKSYAKLLSKDFLHNIDTKSFSYFLFQTWDVVAVALFQGTISQEPLKSFYQNCI